MRTITPVQVSGIGSVGISRRADAVEPCLPSQLHFQPQSSGIRKVSDDVTAFGAARIREFIRMNPMPRSSQLLPDQTRDQRLFGLASLGKLQLDVDEPVLNS